MSKKIAVGVLSGILAGLVFGTLMDVLTVHASNGTPISMIGYLAAMVHPSTPWIGGLIYIVYGAVLGGIYGYLFRDRTLAEPSGAFWGAVYGVGWWVIACVVLVPVVVRSLPFAMRAREAMHLVAFSLFCGHIVYGAVLGAANSWITRIVRGFGQHRISHTTHAAPH